MWNNKQQNYSTEIIHQLKKGDKKDRQTQWKAKCKAKGKKIKARRANLKPD